MNGTPPSRAHWFLCLLGIAAAACSDSASDDGGSGGGPPASGGTAPSGTGGNSGAGRGGTQSATGGASQGGTSGGEARAGGAGQSNTAGTGAAGAAGASMSMAGSGGRDDAGGTGPVAGSAGSTSSGGQSGTGNAGGMGAIAGTGGMMSMGGGGAFTGTCTASEPARSSATGSGPHDVVVETNSDPGIEEGTIFRPADLGGAEKYPIFVWGQGACSRNGFANADAMAEIASHGYFVVADGTPNGSGNREMDRSKLEAMGAPLVAYIDWALAENEKPCSAYYQSLDTTKIASNGFSCGGLMAQGTVLDPRIVTWGVTSSGMAGADQSFYDLIHTPVLFVEGGPGDVAYDGALEGYENTAEQDVPVLWFSKDIGHGGDLFQQGGGDFTKINLAWLNWWLKGDETQTGKGLLIGPSCPYCSDAAWEVMSANVP